MIFTLPTDTPRATRAPILYLENFFSDNTLLLLDQDTEVDETLVSRPETDQVKYSYWDVQCKNIKKFVADNHIQTIVMYASINPITLSRSENTYTPSFLEMQQQLSTVATTYIFTGDFFYYYNPVPGIVFFPAFLWLNSAKLMGKFFADRSNTVYDIDFTDKTKTLMCLNSNTVWHRIYLFSLLAGKPWIGNIGYSFHGQTGHQTDLDFCDRLEDVAVTQFMSPHELAVAKSYAHLIPVQLPEDSIDDKRKSSVHSWIYQDYAINLVTETSLTEGIILTEKTCKPFTAYQIPILIAPPGSAQLLEDLGLDLFADYIPWRTWDHVVDHKLRIRMIVEFLDRLLLNPEAILSTHRDFKSRLIKNKEYFHSTEFQNRLLVQLVSVNSQ
jgi:hypothetical protein